MPKSFVSDVSHLLNIIKKELGTIAILVKNAGITRSIPIGRFGLVEEVAEVAVMLVRNGFITGQTINVNGGLYMS